ncbi:MFS transporter [Peterkaempfera griseoplana]|uniref:hypothetical protein n=1 Tax=Peterkaempfera griseoplana TaxID=66896 RepID=UPI0006E41D2A|nr:hypothetical protein [Peterkaempfera griseoplana]
MVNHAPRFTSVAVTPSQLAAARRTLACYLAGLGLVVAIWGARMPAIQAAAHLNTGRLALVLLAAAAGMVAGLRTGGAIAHRHGPAPLLAAPAAGLGLSLAALGSCRSLPTLTAAAVVFGLLHGLLDIGANSAAVRCQDAHGRPIMSGLHATYSLGALTGAALATTPLPHCVLFTAIGLLTATLALATARATRSMAALPATGPHANASGPARGRPRLMLLGVLAAAALLCEGAAADWSAVHLTTLHATTAVAATSYAAYSAAMAVGRLSGDRLTARHGAPTVVRCGALLAATGLAAGLLTSTLPVALAGWAALGAGLSVTVPTLITAAGRSGPRAVATVTATGYLGLVAGPALIGAFASLSSLPVALGLPVVLAAVIAAASHRALEIR